MINYLTTYSIRLPKSDYRLAALGISKGSSVTDTISPDKAIIIDTVIILYISWLSQNNVKK